MSSMYSTPNASRALAMAILVLVSKKALANCSPSERQESSHFDPLQRMSGMSAPRRVLSMILKLETLLKKSEYRGAYGLCGWAGLVVALLLIPLEWPFAVGAAAPAAFVSTPTMGPVNVSAVGHIVWSFFSN